MKYYLRNTIEKDKSFIYDIKKSSIYDYVQKIWGWNEEYQIKNFESDFILEDFKIISVKDKDVGFIQVIEEPLNTNIIEIHITPEYQGYGIGSEIINSIKEKSVSNNKTITIGSFIDNYRAKKLYERLGFKVMRVTDTYYEMKYKLDNN